MNFNNNQIKIIENLIEIGFYLREISYIENTSDANYHE